MARAQDAPERPDLQGTKKGRWRKLPAFFSCVVSTTVSAGTPHSPRTSQESGEIRFETAMGLFFYLLLFVVICVFGWSSRSGTRHG